jgi:hypothetical protein
MQFGAASRERRRLVHAAIPLQDSRVNQALRRKGFLPGIDEPLIWTGERMEWSPSGAG